MNNKNKIKTEVHLSELTKGQKGIVVSIHGDNKPLRKRLLDMGITRGVEVEIVKIAPLGDPIDIELRGYELCLRRKDLENIHVKKVEK